ncbi:MAG: hypothetical protein M3O34_02010 [Chloroflexota bacterium]|nr:hypothetical protein [Chloroflexota bacterium]
MPTTTSWTLHKQASFAPLEGKLVRMRDPHCPSLRSEFHEGACQAGFGRVFYAVGHGMGFEPPAEIAMYRQRGDIVRYSPVPSISLAPAIGARYGGLYLVSNQAKGSFGIGITTACGR